MDILIYFTGIPICYILFRKWVKLNEGEWTFGYRILGMGISILSWIGIGAFLICIVIHFTSKIDKFNKKVKW